MHITKSTTGTIPMCLQPLFSALYFSFFIVISNHYFNKHQL